MPDEPSELTQQLESMQTVLLSRMEEMINSKMETVHDSLASQQRQLAAVQVDKINDIKFGSAHKFKKKGNCTCGMKVEVDYTDEMVLDNFICGLADKEIKS